MDLLRALVFSVSLAAYPALHYAERVDSRFYYHAFPVSHAFVAWSLFVLVVLGAWYVESRRTGGFRPLAPGFPSIVGVLLTLVSSSALVIIIHRYDISRKFLVYHLSAWLWLLVALLHVCLLVSALACQFWGVGTSRSNQAMQPTTGRSDASL